jgi:hypothetical protein
MIRRITDPNFTWVRCVSDDERKRYQDVGPQHLCGVYRRSYVNLISEMDPEDRSPAVSKKLRSKAVWLPGNAMYFPKGLRDAIPAWENSARMLRLTNIDGNCSHTGLRGRRIELSFHVEETGKLNGAFNVLADLEIEAARALAATLEELVKRAEGLPPENVPNW